jgi:hypothetical protein
MYHSQTMSQMPQMSNFVQMPLPMQMPMPIAQFSSSQFYNFQNRMQFQSFPSCPTPFNFPNVNNAMQPRPLMHELNQASSANNNSLIDRRFIKNQNIIKKSF